LKPLKILLFETKVFPVFAASGNVKATNMIPSKEMETVNR
jgi:hypothetical protein